MAQRVAVVTEGPGIGMREEDYPTDEAGLQKLLHLIDTFEPVEMTPEEEREWMEAREESKRVSIEAVRRQMNLAE